MVYVGIDQSYTGFGFTAINAVTGKHESYLGKFDLAKYENQGRRLAAIQVWLRDCLSGVYVDGACMEGYANGAKFGREMAGELGGAVKLYFTKQLLPFPISVPPTSVKKYATGSGTAKKNEILLNVYKRWGVEFRDDNLADSFVLAKIAEAIDKQPTDLPKFQQEVLSKLK